MAITMGTKQPTGFKAGKITVGTSKVQGPNVPVATGEAVILSSAPNNTKNIWIGDSGVAINNGFELVPGSGVAIKVDNVNRLWFISEASGQVVYYACEVP